MAPKNGLVTIIKKLVKDVDVVEVQEESDSQFLEQVKKKDGFDLAAWNALTTKIAESLGLAEGETQKNLGFKFLTFFGNSKKLVTTWGKLAMSARRAGSAPTPLGERPLAAQAPEPTTINQKNVRGFWRSLFFILRPKSTHHHTIYNRQTP
jgi:hypothetical protein